MPEISDKSTAPLEGVILPKITTINEVFEQIIQINSGQLLEAVGRLNELTRVYSDFALQTSGVLNVFFKQQEQIAQTLAIFTEKLSIFGNIDLFIKGSLLNDIVETNTLPTHSSPIVQVFVQPSTSQLNQPLKALPVPKRKQNLPLTEVNIERNGFSIQGEYIKGMTRKSKPGRLFELMISKNLAGIIPDELISKIAGVDVDDYQAWGFVLRDLKVLLAGNKLELNLLRYRGIGKYKVKALTKYIRKPKKKKKIANTSKSN